jgi:hypothetical protein
VKEWIKQIKEYDNNDFHGGKHKESPSLSLVVEKNKEKMNIQEVKESTISALMDSPEAYIFHLKSDAGLETIEKRITQPHLLNYVGRYFRDLQ